MTAGPEGLAPGRFLLQTMHLEVANSSEPFWRNAAIRYGRRSTGQRPCASARETQPDLIVLDLQMPALDGFGVLKELRSQQRFIRTPIVALTATAMQGDRDRALAAGFTGYVSKPIGVCALRAEMQRWLA